jgi:hypothetical protein
MKTLNNYITEKLILNKKLSNNFDENKVFKVTIIFEDSVDDLVDDFTDCFGKTSIECKIKDNYFTIITCKGTEDFIHVCAIIAVEWSMDGRGLNIDELDEGDENNLISYIGKENYEYIKDFKDILKSEIELVYEKL